MGFRCSWVALFEAGLQPALDHFRLKRAGEVPDIYDPGFYAVATNRSSLVVGFGSPYWTRVTTMDAAAISARGRVLFFFFSDTTMHTSLVEYEHGDQVFRIDVDPNEGSTVSGQAPVSPDQVIEYDDVARFGRALTGFRHHQKLTDAESGAGIRVLKRR